MIEYSLIRSNRKTLGLYIRDGVLEVRAPFGISEKDINKLVYAKANWITKQLALAEDRARERRAFSHTYGGMVTYLGMKYPISPKNGNHIGFDGIQFYMPPEMSPEQIKEACVHVYRMLAKRYITDRAFKLSKDMNVVPAAVKISGAKKRWGSASEMKSLNFSWRLIMADEDTVDYVIIHELAHLREMNHSQRFWDIVEHAVPGYRERKTRLKRLHKCLLEEGWD